MDSPAGIGRRPACSAPEAAVKIQEDAASCADCGSIIGRDRQLLKYLNCGGTSGRS